jgi:hypothetical protein
MSKEYWVRIPLAGIIAVNVEAENEEEAQQKAFSSEWNVSIESEKNNVELDEIDQYEEIVSGNVLHAPLNEVEIDEA